MEKRRIITFGTLAILIFPSTAFAYLDPGTGSALIQGLIAAIAAIGLSIKLFWHRFVAMFSGKIRTDSDSKESAAPVQQADENNARSENNP
jgi:uncharacterized membrane protein